LFVLAAAIAAAVPATARADAYGAPIIANTVTSGHQEVTGVFSCAHRNSAVLWTDTGRGDGLYSRLFSGGGIALQPSENFVNPTGGAVPGTGCFATTTTLSDGDGGGAFVTVYDQAGNVVIPQFRANDTISGIQVAASAAVNASGQFAVSWLDARVMPNVIIWSVYVKLFRANGTSVAPAQLVFTAASGDTAGLPSIAINDQSAFVVAWQTGGGPNYDVYFRRYSSSGFASGPALLAAANSAGFQMAQNVAIGPAGDFVVAWETSPDRVTGWQSYARHFDANSAALTGDIQITTEANMNFHSPNVAMDPSGNFMVTWYDWHNESGVQSQVFARYYSSAGIALGPQLVVPTDTTLVSYLPVIAMDGDGNATIAWWQFDPVKGDVDVAVRRYQPVGITVQPIADGATIDDLSGATGSWQYFKVTVPPGHSTVDIFISGSVGDADLYVRYGAIPSATSWDGRPFLNGSNEGAEMLNFPAGDWHIGINGFAAYSSLSLEVISH
jgi:hypothetical protein